MPLRHLFYLIVTVCFLTAHGFAILKIADVAHEPAPAMLSAGD
ncbi:hypothetical protein [Tardiphaga alba]|nr:hypothetical protein [Tardiphaga alba]